MKAESGSLVSDRHSLSYVRNSVKGNRARQLRSISAQPWLACVQVGPTTLNMHVYLVDQIVWFHTIFIHNNVLVI